MSCPHSLCPTTPATLLPRDRFGSLPAPALPFRLAQDKLPLFPPDLVQLPFGQGFLEHRDPRRAPERRQLAAVPVHIVLILQPVPPRVGPRPLALATDALLREGAVQPLVEHARGRLRLVGRPVQNQLLVRRGRPSALEDRQHLGPVPLEVDG